MPDFDWERPLKDLKELKELTGDADGAHRLAWSEDWRKAREWLLGKLEQTDATVERDVAGNLWATVPGESDKIVVVGSHIDAVPHGGWLDGCLGVCAALEVLRGHKGETPKVTLKLIDWADEEGARFGRSLLGSSAAAGTLDPDAVRHLKDAEGISLPDALAENGIDLDTMGEAELPDIAAYLELHIEQGPRLEEAGKPAAAVIGCFGVERHAITFTGKASHAGSTPMNLRRDAFLAAGRFGLAARGNQRSSAAAWPRSAPSPPAPASRRSSTSTARSRSTSARSSPSSCATCSPTSRRPPTGSPKRRASRSSGSRSGRSTRSRSTSASSTSRRRPSARSRATTTRRGCRPAPCTTAPRWRAGRRR